jgi:hypothetical protein
VRDDHRLVERGKGLGDVAVAGAELR